MFMVFENDPNTIVDKPLFCCVSLELSVCEPAHAISLSAYPDIAGVVLKNCMNLIIRQPVVCGVVLDSAFGKFIQTALIGSNPNIAIPVLHDCPGVVVGDTVRRSEVCYRSIL